MSPVPPLISSVTIFFRFPSVMFYRQNAACPLSNRGRQRRQIKGREAEMLNCITVIMLERYISLQLAEQRMRLWVLMSLHRGTCVETKGCTCRPCQTPPPTPSLLSSPERDRPRAERRSLPGGVIRLGPKSPAGRPVCDWRRPSPALVTGWHLWQAGDSFSRQVH